MITGLSSPSRTLMCVMFNGCFTCFGQNPSASGVFSLFQNQSNCTLIRVCKDPTLIVGECPLQLKRVTTGCVVVIDTVTVCSFPFNNHRTSILITSGLCFFNSFIKLVLLIEANLQNCAAVCFCSPVLISPVLA